MNSIPIVTAIIVWGAFIICGVVINHNTHAKPNKYHWILLGSMIGICGLLIGIGKIGYDTKSWAIWWVNTILAISSVLPIGVLILNKRWDFVVLATCLLLPVAVCWGVSLMMVFNDWM